MAILLDTQILIWLEEEPDRIKESIKEKISREADVSFSIVSVWQMAIKLKTGKLVLKMPLNGFVSGLVDGYSFSLLNISKEHVYYTQNLEMHHKDPFDRLIIAQSIVERLEMVTADEIFNLYGVNRIW